jgi:anti-sigma regulatory factor (Ser/Thr protein kinase)
MRAALRAYAFLDPDPSTVVARMDALVASQASEQVVTLAYGVVDAERRTLRLTLAGHPPPVVLSAGEKPGVLAEGSGSALGIGAGPWPETSLDLSPGRVVLFYSDGLVETRDRDLFDGIAELVAHVDGIATRRRQPRDLCARLSQLMTDDHSDDDVTLLAVAAAPTDAVRRASVRLPSGPIAPREARGFLRGTLADWDVDEDTRDSAELCVSELVTNVVIHTGTSAELTVHLDDEVLTVLVHDSGTFGSVSRPEHDDPMTISGRGLGLVDAVATSWAAEHGADGTTVWFEIERP